MPLISGIIGTDHLLVNRDILNDIVNAMRRSLAPETACQEDIPGQNARGHSSDHPCLLESPFTTSQSRPFTGLVPSTEDDFLLSSLIPPATPHSEPVPALPLHSHELGRLPVWSDEGVSCPTTIHSPTNTWPRFAFTMASSRPTMPSMSSPDVGQEQPQLAPDPELEALFAELIPDGVYGHPFGLMS